MLYTISLHIAATADASRVRRFASSLHAHLSNKYLQQLGMIIFVVLHAIPVVGIFAMTSVELAIAVKSPTVAIAITILCFLPAMMAIFLYTYEITSGDLPSTPSTGRSDSSAFPEKFAAGFHPSSLLAIHVYNIP